MEKNSRVLVYSGWGNAGMDDTLGRGARVGTTPRLRMLKFRKSREEVTSWLGRTGYLYKLFTDFR